MKTKYIRILAKRLSILTIAFMSTMVAFAQADGPGAVWQWSIPVKGAMNTQGQSRAYMWIPANCSKIRGLVLVQNNMQELSIVENQQFRDSLTSIGFGEVWVAPAFRPFFNAMEGDKKVLEQLLKDLADKSGYPEVFYVPLVPIGHSAMANFGFQVLTACPDRALCGISTSGMMPYDWGNGYGVNTQCGTTVDYIPYLTAISEMESGGEPTSSGEVKYGFTLRTTYPKSPISFLGIPGEFHFATTQYRTNFFAFYIKKAAKYRLAADATSTSYATLTPIDPTTTGWLVDRWQRDMHPRYPAASVASYTGSKSQNFWCFDEDMARQTEAFEGSFFRKKPSLIAYNQSSVKGLVGAKVPQSETHVQVHLSFYPLNDSLDFELSSSFLDSIPATSSRCTHFMSTTDTITGGTITPAILTRITHPVDNSLSVIDRECNMFTKLRKDPITGITTFRLTLDRGLPPTATNYVQFAIFGVRHPGDEIYKSSVLQADMSISVRNTSGISQTINFPQIPNVTNTTNTVSLNATSSAGLPVQYYVEEGPAKIVGNKIVFTTLPQNATLPMKVTVVAWQWGRNSSLAANMTASGVPYPGQTIQTAQPIINTFYITGRLTPQVDLTLSGSKMTVTLNRISWTTNSQVNNKTYIVERSLNNTSWSQLGSVAANSSGFSYLFDDTNAVNGINYYRLKIVSEDGTLAYSNTISVNGGTSETIIPTSSKINIRKIQDIIETSGCVVNANVIISVVDCSGRIILRNNMVVPQTGIIQTKLPVLSSGIYLVSVRSESDVKSLKFVY